MSGQSIRTFIALEIEEKIKEEIIQIQDRIKQSNAISGKWVTKDNLHLTLKFLGDTQLKYIDEIKEKIRECLRNEPKINCNLSRVGLFPNERFTRVIWVAIEGGDTQIINIAKKLEDALSKMGFEKEKREFKTHITICRTKQVLNLDQFKLVLEEINKNFKPIKFIINKITFFESKLTPKGPIYTSIADYFLE